MYIETVEYYSVVKNNISKSEGKWMELEKNHSEWGKPDPERKKKNLLCAHS